MIVKEDKVPVELFLVCDMNFVHSKERDYIARKSQKIQIEWK